ncbi:MAG: hypothetical protein AAF193_10710, partial [Bacteroidota bacterium]
MGADINCNNDSTTTATINLNQPFEYNCSYNLDVVLGIPDNCDSIWVFHIPVAVSVTDCGISGQILQDPEEICAGQCTNLTLELEGCFNFTYNWDNGLPSDAGPHTVCPVENTIYTVEVTEVETGVTQIFSTEVAVTNAGIEEASMSVCQSEDAFSIPVTQPNGEWFGPGIQDPVSGLFEPDSADIGINILYYVLSPACYDSITVNVIEIDAGLPTAACPGTPPFQLDGTPTTGIWDGPFTDPDGIFTPSDAGTWQITFSANGCEDIAIVNVDDISGTFLADTLCQSEFPFQLDFSPQGGQWIGPGFIDDYLGIFEPEAVGAGTYDLIYQINGCNQILPMTIKEIDTGGRSRNACPEQLPFVPYEEFAPTGGYWEGNGIIDQNAGI